MAQFVRPHHEVELTSLSFVEQQQDMKWIAGHILHQLALKEPVHSQRMFDVIYELGEDLSYDERDLGDLHYGLMWSRQMGYTSEEGGIVALLPQPLDS